MFQVAFLREQVKEYLVDVCTVLVSYGSHIRGTWDSPVSPLHSAVRWNSPSIVAALLSSREKFPEVVNQALTAVDGRRGLTALHIAVWNGVIDCGQLLIEAGADVNAVCEDRRSGQSVITPLELAVTACNKDAVHLLLQSPGCQVDKVGSRKATALLHAISRGLTVILYDGIKGIGTAIFDMSSGAITIFISGQVVGARC